MLFCFKILLFLDFVAYRDGECGSIYIKNLSHLLFQQGFKTKLTDILTQVTEITSIGLTNVCQVPSFTSTLTMSLLFTRKKTVSDSRSGWTHLTFFEHLK